MRSTEVLYRVYISSRILLSKGKYHQLTQPYPKHRTSCIVCRSSFLCLLFANNRKVDAILESLQSEASKTSQSHGDFISGTSTTKPSTPSPLTPPPSSPSQTPRIHTPTPHRSSNLHTCHSQACAHRRKRPTISCIRTW